MGQMDLERTMEFLLQQQANFEAREAAATERHNREVAEIRHIIAETQEIGRQTRLELRRAVRLGVQEARAERRRCREADEKLAAGQETLQQSLTAFIDSMRQPRNGHDKN